MPILGACHSGNTDGDHATTERSAARSAATCNVTASDNVRVTHIAISREGARSGVYTVYTGPSASNESVFASDYRGSITIQATNMAGLSATCSTKISTFTTSLEWPAVAATMDLKGETVAASDAAGAVYSNTDACYHIGTSYTVEGPEGYGFGKEKLFVNPSGKASDISYRVELLPRVRQLVFVDQESGDIVISPLQEHTNTTFTAVLYGKDVGSAEAEVKRWQFAVRARPTFRVAAYTRVAPPLPTQGAAVAPVINVTARSKTPFVVGEAFRFAPVTLTSVDHAEIAACTFTIRGDTEGIFVNPKTGEVQGLAVAEGQASFILEAIDAHGARDVVETATLTFQHRDTSNPANGPSNRTCSHNGRAVDGVTFDRAFTCDCSGTTHSGDNCNQAAGDPESSASASSDSDTAIRTIASVLAMVIVFVCAFIGLAKYNRHKQSMMATDFTLQLKQMKDSGSVDADQIAKDIIPRELKRSWISLIDILGNGAFGEVWKGLLIDGANSNSPEFLVAAKVIKKPVADLDAADTMVAEQDLLKEALLMAQVDTHTHLVSLIGVITRGHPKILVLSFCEHGELLKALKKHGPDGSGPAFHVKEKYRFCKEIATGMAHLALHTFVHRDLAARNVLLGSGMVCKIADFGMSRRVQTDANLGDYYRSTSGIIPVRWTAPEGLTNMKFSTASDVWSYGITCVEIFQDGVQPYHDVLSNPEVMTLVTSGKVHSQPGCVDEVYTELLRCWSVNPQQRPGFEAFSAFFMDMDSKTADPVLVAIKGADARITQDRHYMQVLQQFAGSDAILDELQHSGDIITPGPDQYCTSEYLRLGEERKASIRKEESIVGGLNGVQISEKLGEATDELVRIFRLSRLPCS